MTYPIQVSIPCKTKEELQGMLNSLITKGYKAVIRQARTKGEPPTYILFRAAKPKEDENGKWIFNGKQFILNTRPAAIPKPPKVINSHCVCCNDPVTTHTPKEKVLCKKCRTRSLRNPDGAYDISGNKQTRPRRTNG